MARRPILTAEEMRAAEAKAIEGGVLVETLMERAGTAAAEAIRRFAGPLPALLLCGPGNNGGDGYVIARELRERGVKVRVAALGEPRSSAARSARARWAGEVEALENAAAAPLLIDSLFGTGLRRGLNDAAAATLLRLAAEARIRIAVDVPSGVSTDDGAILSPVPDYDLTITFATLKPCHLLQPAARHMGRIVVADIGIDAESRLHEIGRPLLRPPGPDDHKYKRGYVALIAGEMPGAGSLTASAAARAGAGYVRIVSNAPVSGVPNAVVQSPGRSLEQLRDGRINAIAIGPGLGRTEDARALLEQVLGLPQPLVLDADALHLLSPERIRQLASPAILTPHAGEFAQLFGAAVGSKVDQARAAAERAAAVVVYKGADTVVAAPDGRAAIAPPASPWLASAGTGDILTGIIAAMRARGLEPFEAACAGMWVHGRAAALAGQGLIADNLIERLPAALAECSG
jgi:hydroxyethylthiazole kinase-like uncharacterized protein yjeF